MFWQENEFVEGMGQQLPLFCEFVCCCVRFRSPHENISLNAQLNIHEIIEASFNYERTIFTSLPRSRHRLRQTSRHRRHCWP